MRRPLRRRGLADRLRALAPRPFTLVASLVILTAAGGTAMVMREDGTLAGEPVVRLAMPQPETATASTDAAATPEEEEAPELAPPAPDPLPGETVVEEVTPEEAPPAPIEAAPISLPKAPLPGLSEKGPQGLLPRISADGRKPASAYARPISAQADAGPRIALIIGGLGLNRPLSRRALDLPGEVTLALAPYGDNLQKLADEARSGGHELLLQLPMEPAGYPRVDPGPNTLRAGPEATGNLLRLQWLLARFQGYFGVTNYLGSRFLADAAAVAGTRSEISRRGLAWVMAPQALPIDAPDRAVVMKNLAELEARAAKGGIAVGVGTGLDVTLDAVDEWARGLSARGIQLVPVSAALAGAPAVTSAAEP